MKKALALTVFALCLAGPALAQSAGQTAASSSLGVREIAEADMNGYVAKSNAVVGLLNTSLRASESWRRYLSWVNPNRGPTGKERIIYGLYSVGESSARDAIAKARESAGAEPAIPALDGATKSLASAFETLVPILNEAEAYYERKDYLSDGMKGGQALHARLVPAAQAFLDARAKTEMLQEQFKELLDTTRLASLEKTEGKSPRWHLQNTMMKAKKAVDLMPTSPRRGTDLKAFDAALASFGEATRDFDNAVRASGKTSSVDSSPRDILGKLREMRDNIAKGRADAMTFSFDYNAVIQRYNMMVTMSNAFGR